MTPKIGGQNRTSGGGARNDPPKLDIIYGRSPTLCTYIRLPTADSIIILPMIEYGMEISRNHFGTL